MKKTKAILIALCILTSNLIFAITGPLAPAFASSAISFSTVKEESKSKSSSRTGIEMHEDLPDLVVGSYWLKSDTISEGEPFWVKAEVKNSGTGTAGPSHVKLYLSTDDDFDISDDYYLGEKPIGALQSGQTGTQQWDFDMPDIGSGAYPFWVLFVADCYNLVNEADEDNIFKGNNSKSVICSYQISPTGTTVESTGGIINVDVAALSGCAWNAMGGDWITITSGISGSGDGTVVYSVSSNSTEDIRIAIMSIADKTFAITQAGGSSCSYEISPMTQAFAPAGGSGSVSVFGQDECYWNAKAESNWITLKSGFSGNGSGKLSYEVMPNYTMASRSAEITIAGENFEIFQAGGAPEESQSYKFERMWPTLRQSWYFNLPSHLAVDTLGNVYIADTNNYQVQKFTPSGEFITKWGDEKDEDGAFYPHGIATDSFNNVYLTDMRNHCVRKFSSSGVFVTQWGSKGAADGQFSSPYALLADQDGYIYVADTYNHRIQKFTSSGQFIASWGVEGNGKGEFHYPSALAVDDTDNIYVGDYGNHRIQKLTSSGEFIAEWGKEGNGNGEFSGIESISTDKNGNIYVSDSSNGIQKFTPAGEFIAKWGNTFGFEDGQFNFASGIVTGISGNVYVADSGSERIQLFTNSGEYLNKWGSSGFSPGEFNNPFSMAMDNDGNIYVADTESHRIQKFNAKGQFLTMWGNKGDGDGEFYWPEGIALDKDNNVFVADSANHRIQKFTSSGKFITKWGTKGLNDGELKAPAGIDTDSYGNVYVVDNYNHRIQKFTSSGEFISKWGYEGSGEGEFSFPRGIALDIYDNVFVADLANSRIQKFTSSGEFISKWGNKGSGEGEFDSASGLAVDNQGNIYVADCGNNRIQKFMSDGTVLEVGTFGSHPGLLKGPRDVEVDSKGRIFVLDTINNRIQIFKPVTTGSNNKAIVLAGGGPKSNDLWDSTEMCVNFAYHTLTYQGFTKESIYYLTSDLDLDLDSNGEQDDVDGDATNNNLRKGITEWAADADNLLLYLTDHGGIGNFRMSGNEMLSASELDAWLDTVQEIIPGRVIVVYDACHSGSFLPMLTPPAGKERIVITSTTPEESAKFITSGSISFSNYFWTHVFNGVSITNAFDLAKEALAISFSDQNPLLDADGNGIGNETEDYARIANLYIGNGTEIYGDAPIIGNISEDQTISDTPSALLSAWDVTDDDGIARVWAVIRPPDYAQETSDNPVTELPFVDLMPVGENQYEGEYTGFNTAGTYQIAIYARDRIGNTSIPKLTTVSVENPLRKKAVIIIGASEADEFWPVMEQAATLAYEALTYQGYSYDDIYFMSPKVFPGWKGDSTLRNFNHAINTWAAENAQDLVLYMVGKGYEETFQINDTEYIAASELDMSLDVLQETIPGKVTLIYDACLSGSFLPVLSPPLDKDRILISSTGENQAAHFICDGNLSFSSFFWSRILNGTNVRDAFLHAMDALALAFSNNEQVPQLDADGNGIGNEMKDKSLAQKTTIGAGIMLAADDPMIGSVSPPGEIVWREARIWAEDVTSTGTIQKVWAVITPPGKNMQNPADPVADLATFELHPLGSGRYEGVFNGFAYYGLHQVSVFAMDDQGNVSLPKVTTVMVAPSSR